MDTATRQHRYLLYTLLVCRHVTAWLAAAGFLAATRPMAAHTGLESRVPCEVQWSRHAQILWHSNMQS